MKLLASLFVAVFLLVPSSSGTNVVKEGHSQEQQHRKLWIPTTDHDPTATLLSGQYIVAFQDHTPAVATKAAQHFSTEQIQHVYDGEYSAIKGVSVVNVSDRLLTKLLDDPDVLYVEQNVQKSAPGDHRRGLLTMEETNSPSATPMTKRLGTIETQTSVEPHLDRLDQRMLPLDGKYKYIANGGEGVTVFVVDSGMLITHSELVGRATCGLDIVVGKKRDGSAPCADLMGHGTAVGALVGGVTVGVAKAVSIVAVKVGTKQSLQLDALVAGLSYVLQQKQENPSRPMVVNLSLGFLGLLPTKSIDRSVQKLLQANVTVVASAANGRVDSCQFTPSRVRSAITVGASDPSNDIIPRWSKGGHCVDIYAPGVRVRTASSSKQQSINGMLSRDHGFSRLSGASFAAPLVAGAAALYLQQHPTWTPSQVWEAMRKDAVPHVLEPRRRRGETNFLLQTGPLTGSFGSNTNEEDPKPSEKLCGKRGLLNPWLCWWK